MDDGGVVRRKVDFSATILVRLPTNPDDEFHVKNRTNDWQPGCSHAYTTPSPDMRAILSTQ